MNDTSQHIYDLQLKLWLSKTPEERLHRLLVDNEALFKFWNHARPAADTNDKLIVTKEMIQENLIVIKEGTGN